MIDLKTPVSLLGGLAPSATLSLAAKAKAMKADGKDVVSFTAGEPDFDTPEHIKEAAAKALREGKTKYTPTAGELELRKAIAEKLLKENGVPCKPEQVIVGPGAKFSCFSAVTALCGAGDEVILPAPYWVSYIEMIKAAGAKAVILDCKAEDNYEVDPVRLEAAVTPRTRLMILNSPSNPTGAVYRRRTIERIAELAVKKNFMIMSDEIYEKLVYDTDLPHVSIASLGKEIAALTITVNGFSKAFSMTGWRLGYLAAPDWLAKRISSLQDHTTSNPTTFAQYGALAALRGPAEPVERMRQAFAVRRDLVHQLMGSIPGVRCVRPSGAFYLFCDVSSFGLDSMTFCSRLLDESLVAVIPGQPFGAEGSIRISYACSEANLKEGCSRIKAFCGKLR